MRVNPVLIRVNSWLSWKNKPNFQKGKMNAKSIITRGYGKYIGLDTWWKQTQFKANSKPICRFCSEIAAVAALLRNDIRISAPLCLSGFVAKRSVEKTNPIWRRVKLTQTLFWKDLIAINRPDIHNLAPADIRSGGGRYHHRPICRSPDGSIRKFAGAAPSLGPPSGGISAVGLFKRRIDNYVLAGPGRY